MQICLQPITRAIIATAASLRASEDGIHCFALRYWIRILIFATVSVSIFVPVDLISRKVYRPVCVYLDYIGKDITKYEDGFEIMLLSLKVRNRK